jgi:Mrp family chromosome partitioning ATPase
VRFGDTQILATQKATVRHSAELLQSDRAAAALEDILGRYQPTVAIFDMPPMLVGDDMMAFASRVDCVLLVAAAGETSVKQVDVCERDLAGQTNILGVVLNKCRYLGNEDAYGYYA